MFRVRSERPKLTNGPDSGGGNHQAHNSGEGTTKHTKFTKRIRQKLDGSPAGKSDGETGTLEPGPWEDRDRSSPV